MAKKRVLSTLKPASPNMTPMIDVVFLLISFFTLVMNFSQTELHEDVVLPLSELAQPPEGEDPEQITLQALSNGHIVVGTVDTQIESNLDYASTTFCQTLTKELNWRRVIRKVQPKDVTVIIRGDSNAETGFIQHIIAACQSIGADTYVLRARQTRDD